MNNPRYWASQWYATKFAEEPWPGGWYWHDQQYNWHGPYESERDAAVALKGHQEQEREASDAHERSRPQFELYYHPLSTYSQKVLIAIYEKGLVFKPHIVNLMAEGERERYRKIYPLGKIPLIVLNHGPLIPESSIIIEYLESLGGAPLISTNSDVARKTRFKDRFIDFYLTDSIISLFSESRKPEDERDTGKIETARYRSKAVYDFLEYELTESEWANGDEFSLSDCAAGAAFCYAAKYMPYNGYPVVSAYAERLAERPSVRRVREEVAARLDNIA
ncbi:MAG: glutathione S-transferase family protein [Rhodospirillaceae bacterium]|nr:glutathione S-transferase family protein [Rhodospirillaceae bacterium]